MIILPLRTTPVRALFSVDRALQLDVSTFHSLRSVVSIHHIWFDLDSISPCDPRINFIENQRQFLRNDRSIIEILRCQPLASNWESFGSRLTYLPVPLHPFAAEANQACILKA